MSHAIVLDNEAFQAIENAQHPKHNRVVAHLQVAARRKSKAHSISTMVPTAVRVEAGWDRTAPTWAFANRLRIADVDLDREHANTAAALRSRLGTHVSVADAHIGAVIQLSAADKITILTSDPDDIAAVAGSTQVEIVTI